MSFNTEQIVQEIRAELESMLAYVTDGTAKTADQAERELFKRLLGLGAQLLLVFFQQRAASYPHSGQDGGWSGTAVPVQQEAHLLLDLW
jgi:hypothetical protein